MSRGLDRGKALVVRILAVLGLGASASRGASANAQGQNGAIARILSAWPVETAEGKAATESRRDKRDELRRVVAHMLDSSSMSRSMALYVEDERKEVFANSVDAAEDEKIYSGYGDRVRGRIAQEVQ